MLAARSSCRLAQVSDTRHRNINPLHRGGRKPSFDCQPRESPVVAPSQRVRSLGSMRLASQRDVEYIRLCHFVCPFDDTASFKKSSGYVPSVVLRQVCTMTVQNSCCTGQIRSLLGRSRTQLQFEQHLTHVAVAPDARLSQRLNARHPLAAVILCPRSQMVIARLLHSRLPQ